MAVETPGENGVTGAWLLFNVATFGIGVDAVNVGVMTLLGAATPFVAVTFDCDPIG